MHERRTVHIHDVATVPGYPEIFIGLGKQRTSLGVPLLREGEAIGFIVLARQRVESFTDRQIELVSTFADQAVIAIENARLITEQREALEQQTATAEVLQVINASPGNLTPVFDAMLEKAVRLCDSSFGILATYDGECFHNVATRGTPSALTDFLREPIRPAPGTSVHRVVRGEDVVHVADITDDEAYRRGYPARRALADLGGGRTQLVVALRKDDSLLGLVNVYRQEVQPFTEQQIALLRNFAAQAVIAMENARLITEQREALEQQTATAEVLQVINASPGDLVPVFDAILEKAHSLCGAAKGALVTFDGQHFRAVATRGLSETYAQMLREPRTTRGSLLERLLNGASFALEDTSTSTLPLPRAATELEGVRTVLLVPLRRDSTLLGYITAYSQEARAFTEKHIALLQNFAAQAVIAMENARLITEQREALEQQTATAEVLQVINASPWQPSASLRCDARKGDTPLRRHLWPFSNLRRGGIPAGCGIRRSRPARPSSAAYALFRPWSAQPDKPLPARRAADSHQRCGSERGLQKRSRIGGNWWITGACRSVLAVALRKDTILLGYISVYRQELRAFTRQADRVAGELRRSGGDRDGERAAAGRNPPAPGGTPRHLREHGRRRRHVRRNAASGRMEPQIPGHPGCAGRCYRGSGRHSTSTSATSLSAANSVGMRTPTSRFAVSTRRAVKRRFLNAPGPTDG